MSTNTSSRGRAHPSAPLTPPAAGLLSAPADSDTQDHEYSGTQNDVVPSTDLVAQSFRHQAKAARTQIDWLRSLPQHSARFLLAEVGADLSDDVTALGRFAGWIADVNRRVKNGDLSLPWLPHGGRIRSGVQFRAKTATTPRTVVGFDREKLSVEIYSADRPKAIQALEAAKAQVSASAIQEKEVQDLDVQELAKAFGHHRRIKAGSEPAVAELVRLLWARLPTQMKESLAQELAKE